MSTTSNRHVSLLSAPAVGDGFDSVGACVPVWARGHRGSRALRAPPSLTPPLRLTRPPYVARTVASAKSEDKAIAARRLSALWTSCRRARSAEDRDAGAERHARGRNGLPRSVAARSNADGARATSSVLPVATLALRSQGAEGRSRGGRCKVFMKCQGCSTAGVCSKWPHNVSLFGLFVHVGGRT